MSVFLTSNFFTNARGFTLTDGGGITWSINKNTNAITATTGSGGGLSGANPSAKVGLAAVNGTAVTYMTSDSAPPIDQAITPAWTGAHAWSSTLAASANPLTPATTRVATGLAAVKTTLSTASSSTLATDAALTLTFNETGWYEVELWLTFFEATSGTGGFQFNFLNGGTATYGTVTLSVAGFSTAAIALTAAVVSSATAIGAATISTSSSAPSWFRAKGVIQVTAAGTGGVQWAQNSTLSADPTTLMVGSYVSAIKIG